MSRSVTASTAFIGAAELIEELGGDPHAIALESGLLPSVYSDPGTVVSGDAFVDFLELAARRCPCPDFGLRHALRWPAVALGPLWLSVRSASSVREAITDFMTHFGVFSDAAGYRVENDGGDLFAYFEPVAAGRWGAAQWVDASLGYLAAFVRAHATPGWQPPLVHVRHSPAKTELYTRTFGPNLVTAQSDGQVKILADAATDRILGAHVIGPRAGDLIAELAVAIEFSASSEDVARSSHAHPTLAEVVKEAALAVDGRAIHN